MNKSDIIFIMAGLGTVPDPMQENVWELTLRKIRRHHPWLLEDGHKILKLCVGKGWCGWRKRGNITWHALFPATPWIPINIIFAWVTHIVDILILLKQAKRLVVLVPTVESGLSIALLKGVFKKRIRLVVRVIGHTASRAIYVKKSNLRFKLLDKIERFVLRRADLILPIGQFTEKLAILKGAEPGRIIRFPSFPALGGVKVSLSDLPTDPVLLYAGRLEKEKGVHILLQALVKIKRYIPSIKLLIAGEGSFRPELERLVELLDLKENVRFLGWLSGEKLIEAFRSAQMLILPSIIEEGVGMALVDAGLIGRPVIGSDLGGIRDIIHDGKNGLLFPPGDALALAEAILKLLNDREKAQKMGLENYKIALKYLQDREHAVKRVRQAIYALCYDEA